MCAAQSIHIFTERQIACHRYPAQIRMAALHLTGGFQHTACPLKKFHLALYPDQHVDFFLLIQHKRNLRHSRQIHRNAAITQLATQIRPGSHMVFIQSRHGNIDILINKTAIITHAAVKPPVFYTRCLAHILCLSPSYPEFGISKQVIFHTAFDNDGVTAGQ